ncbi:VWA domain-containing protein [Granulicella sp. S156]|uniref:VWA domain-containing protein n=1 Tax=Granulicella sp. S156 TaxID=1747224 RepID=UPI00131EA6F2|nr:VWA domain-containing protein [Granulicella sp. S156]
MRPVFLRLIPALTFALLACAPGLRAQEAPSPDGPPPASTAPGQQERDPDTQTLKVNVNLVDVYFSVRDKSGFITGLHQQDCGLWEDGQQQTIKNFTQEKNLPLTIGILLDTSGSQKNVLPLEQDSGARFLSEVLKPKDEAFLISFDVNVDLLADYTNSARELKRAIDKATINAASSSAGVPGIGGGPFPTSNPRGTLLYDAVYLAAHDKLRIEAGRKILVLLTDGGENGSQETLKTATEAAQKANAIVYVILIADRGFYGGGITLGSTGAREMEQLAQDTGGRVINVGNNGKKLEEAFDQIQDELRTQYLVSYTPKNKVADGKFRKTNIDCGKGTNVQARKGYYAIVGGGDDE